MDKGKEDKIKKCLQMSRDYANRHYPNHYNGCATKVKPMPMEKIVKNCDDCPMMRSDFWMGYHCKHPAGEEIETKYIIEWEDKDVDGHPMGRGTCIPITPNECPLKTDSITIKIEQ